MIRRLLPLVGVLYAILATAQLATATTGELSFTAYSWTTTPQAETQCSTGNFTGLILEWDSQPLPGCPSDNFLLDIRGALYSPGPATQYALFSDDGARLYIDGELVVWNWWNRGCSGFVHDLQLSEGWHDIRIEYYENGGGTCLELWQVTSAGWSEIPGAYLNDVEPVPPATTTTEPEPATTTTTSQAPTTTTIEPTTTIPETSTSYQPTTSTTSTTSTTYQPTESTTSPTTTSTIDTTSQTSPAMPSTIPEIPATVANTNEPITRPINTSTTTSSTIPEKITEGMTNEEAASVATDATAVAELSIEEAAQVFEAINTDQLSPEQAAAIVEAVQNAPPSIREQFEDKINIFAGKYDGYIPLGSLVSVGTRRTIIITTGLLVAAPTLRKR